MENIVWNTGGRDAFRSFGGPVLYVGMIDSTAVRRAPEARGQVEHLGLRGRGDGHLVQDRLGEVCLQAVGQVVGHVRAEVRQVQAHRLRVAAHVGRERVTAGDGVHRATSFLSPRSPATVSANSQLRRPTTNGRIAFSQSLLSIG